MWWSPFVFFADITSYLNWAYKPDDLISEKIAKILIEEPFLALQNGFELSSTIQANNDFLLGFKVVGVYLFIYLTYIVLRWHFQGPPKNKSKFIRCILNPFLTLGLILLNELVFLHYSRHSEIISLASSDQSFMSLLEVSGYYKFFSNLVQVKILAFVRLLFWTCLAVKGNKTAIKAT
tara:strand:+ start:732 stop:1265 length:534 start_codon:yes stop_codon:yes gene_type:complete